jgi:hypothetical protein
MPLTATGSLAQNIAGFAAMLAAVPFFQTWTGTANAGAAAARIFIGEVGYPIAGVSIASNVLTVTTRQANNLGNGQVIELAGATAYAMGISGPQTITSIISATQFTVAVTGLANLVETPDEMWVIPCQRPIAVLCPTEGSLRSESIGTGGVSIVSGSIDCLFEADVTSTYWNDEFNATMEMQSAYGELIDGIMATANTYDYIVVNDQETVLDPEFTAVPEQDNNVNRFERWRALSRFTWGLHS